MAVHVRLEGDRAAAQLYLPLARQLLHQVRQLAAASGSAVTGKHMNPNEFTLVYVMKTVGLEVIQIHCTPTSEGSTTLTTQSLPDILSGWTRGAEITEEVGPPAKKFLTAFKPSDKMAKPGGPPAGWGRSQQLAVAPSPTALEFPPTATDATDSQYRRVFASNYSGAMAKCVQTLLGYGRPKKTKVLQGLPLPADGTQVAYDYRFYRTHGLTLFEGKWWLVEISSARGVIACELEIYPGSYARGKGSSRADIKEMAKALYGLPTGRGMLQGAAFDAAVLAGTAVRLMDAAEISTRFYKDWKPHSTALGWLFTPDGSQAHNVAWRQRLGEREGAHFMIAITLKRELDGSVGGSARLDVCDRGRLPDKRSPLVAYEPLTDGSTWPNFHTPLDEPKFACSTPVHVYWEGEGVKQLRYRARGRKENDEGGYKLGAGPGPKYVQIPKDPGPGFDEVLDPVQEIDLSHTWVEYPEHGVYASGDEFAEQATRTVSGYRGLRDFGPHALQGVSTEPIGDNAYPGGAVYGPDGASPPHYSAFDSGGLIVGPSRWGHVGFTADFLFGEVTRENSVEHKKKPRRLPFVPRGLRDGFGEVTPSVYKTTTEGRGDSFYTVRGKHLAMFTAKLSSVMQFFLDDDDKKAMKCAGGVRRSWWNVNNPDTNAEYDGDTKPPPTARELAFEALYRTKGRFPPLISPGMRYWDLLQVIATDTPEVRRAQGLHPFLNSGTPPPLPNNPYTTTSDTKRMSEAYMEVTAFGVKRELGVVPDVKWEVDGERSVVYGVPGCVASAFAPHAAVAEGVFPAKLGGTARPLDTRFVGALQGEDSTKPASYFNFIGAP